MRSPIRNLILAPALMAAAALAVTTASAATQLNVPFSFTVAGKTCPAGTYTVERGVNVNSVILSSNDAARSFVWVTAPGEPLPTDQRVILTFDRSGDTHALQSVQFGNRITARLDKAGKKHEYEPTRVMTGE
jgi:type 1 fimbria pilin